MTILSRDETRKLYRSTARFYDAALWVYHLLGVARWRRRAVRWLDLKPGDTVVDMGCGTGLNFPYLEEAVGPEGHVVGVDLTDAMLDKAQRRCAHNGWENVELVEADLTAYTFPGTMDGALATFSLEMIPEHDALVGRVAHALPAGGRLAVVGLRVPERWPAWLTRAAVWLNKPFGASTDYSAIRPWESMRRHLHVVEHRALLFGAAYTSVGERVPDPP